MAELNTVPQLFLHRAHLSGGRKIAMRKKKYGLWQEYTWQQSHETVKYLCLGLISLGLNPGEAVAVIGDNDPESYWVNYAAQAAGAIPVNLYVDTLPSEVAWIINHSHSCYLFARDQEQVDKILDVLPELPKLRKVIYWDPKGLWFYDHPIITSLDKILELGRKHEKSHPELFEQRVEQGKADDPALLTYTSGSTGVMKGVMLTYRNILSGARSLLDVHHFREDDEYFSMVALAWVTEFMLGVLPHVMVGNPVSFAEKPETTQEDMREIAPTVVLYGSRQWEAITRQILMKLNESSWLKKLTYRIFMPIAEKKATLRERRGKANLFWELPAKLAYLAVSRPILDSFGLTRARIAITGGQATGPDTFRFLNSLGVQTLQSYGLSETLFIALHRPGDVDYLTVGRPVLGMTVRISEKGEILAKGDSCFLGYYEDPDNTKKTLEDGWVHTGDAGYIDEKGHLVFIDRLADVEEGRDGLKLSPQFVETRLRFSRYMKDVIVVWGSDPPYGCAMVNIDYDNVGKWAEAHRIDYTTFLDLSQNAEVYKLIEKEISKTNLSLPEPMRVKKYVCLHKEFDADEAELTRTRKLRREFIKRKYAEIVEAFYQDKSHIRVEAQVTYRDGSTRKLSTNLNVATVGKG